MSNFWTPVLTSLGYQQVQAALRNPQTAARGVAAPEKIVSDQALEVADFLTEQLPDCDFQIEQSQVGSLRITVFLPGPSKS